ncbi:tetratricopeptide repeat (TPR)-like superfamily protein [Wolffia australiana]
MIRRRSTVVVSHSLRFFFFFNRRYNSDDRAVSFNDGFFSGHLDNTRVPKPLHGKVSSEVCLSVKDFNFLYDSVKDDGKKAIGGVSFDSGCSVEDAVAISEVIRSSQNVFDDETLRFLRHYRGKLNAALVCEVLRLVGNPQPAVRFFIWAGRQIGYHHTNSTCELLLEVLKSWKMNRVPDSFLKEVGEEDREVLGRLLNVIVLKCCRLGLWNEALEELGRLKDFGFRPSRMTYNSLIQILLLAERLDSAFLVHLEMSRSGLFMDSETMESFAYALCKRGRWVEALNIIDKEDFTPDTSLYTKMIEGLVEASLFEEAMGFLERMRSASCHPNVRTYRVLVSGFLRKGQLGWCKRLVKMMMTEGCHPSPSLFNSLVHEYCSAGDYSYAYKLFKKMSSCGSGPGYITYNIFIGSICKRDESVTAEMMELAEKVYMKMLDAGFVLNKVNARNYAQSLCAVGKFGRAFSVIKEMMSKGFVPDASTYGGVIEFLCQAHKIEEALLLFEEMKGNGILPDVYVYTMLIDSFCKVGLIQQAKHWFKEMQSNGCAPNVVTYTALVHGFLKSMRVAEANEVFLDMVAAGCEPNVVTYSALIDGFCKAGEIEKACEVFAKMKGRVSEKYDALQTGPNVFTYGALIDGLCKAQKVEEAHDLLDEMSLSGCDPNHEVYDALIDGFCKAGKLEKAQEVFTRMASRGYSPNVYTYSSLINQLFKDSRLDLVLKVLSSMLEESCPPNVVTYTEMIDGLCKMDKIDEAQKLLIMMEEKGCSPNVVTYTAMIDGLGKGKMVEKALELFAQMTAKGCAPNFITYRVLISHCCAAGLLEKALELLEEMKQTHWPVHFSGFKKVILGFSRDFLCAHGLVEDMAADVSLPVWPVYCLLIDKLVKAGRLDKAVELHRDLMSGSLFSENKIKDLHFVLLEALCTALKMEEALQLFSDFTRCGIVPELELVFWVVKGLLRSRKWSEALEISHSLCQIEINWVEPKEEEIKGKGNCPP